MRVHCFTLTDEMIAEPSVRKDGQRACYCVQEQLSYESILWFDDCFLRIQIHRNASHLLCWHPGSEATSAVSMLGKILLHALPQISLFPPITKDGNEAVSEMAFRALVKRLLHLLGLTSSLLMFISCKGDLLFQYQPSLHLEE